jgi:hypothetical protein
MDPQAKLLAEVEAFLEAERMTPTTFGVRALNDGKFVFRLRAGVNMTIRTMRRAQDFMTTYQRPAVGQNPSMECAA